jgi:DNA-binding transcriptional ArsR family regulator
VTTAERDLVAALRTELAAIDPARACDRAAERGGLGVASNVGAPRRRHDDPVLGRLALRLARPEPVPARAMAGGGEADLAMASDVSEDAGRWRAAPEHCRMAWLRGVFLACGSLSLAGGRTHLEFVVAEADGPRLAARLAGIDLPASSRGRRGRGVVTWKGGETVSTFLRRIGAGPALLELEARQVSRSLRGELNRVLNAESANLTRTVSAAARQLAAIHRLEVGGTLLDEPPLVRRVADARRETPEATITELAERLGLHRSAVQRSLERLERVALHGRAQREEPAAPLA